MLTPNIGDVCLVVFGAICQQGAAMTPRSIASRIIMVVAFMILMFLYTSYSANIVALLQSPSSRIKTLEDLYQSRLQLGVYDTVYNRYYFSVTNEVQQPEHVDDYFSFSACCRANAEDDFHG